jgi:hypothetical protein
MHGRCSAHCSTCCGLATERQLLCAIPPAMPLCSSTSPGRAMLATCLLWAATRGRRWLPPSARSRRWQCLAAAGKADGAGRRCGAQKGARCNLHALDACCQCRYKGVRRVGPNQYEARLPPPTARHAGGAERPSQPDALQQQQQPEQPLGQLELHLGMPFPSHGLPDA